MRKFFAAVLIVSLTVLCFAVPAFATETKTSPTEQAYMTVNGAVVQLRNAMENRESPIVVQFWSALPESSEMAQTVFYSAIAHTGVPTQGDYLYRHIKGLKFSCESEALSEGYLSTVTYTVTYRTTAQQEAQVDAKVAEILDRLNVYQKNDYQKILAIYNYLCSHVTTPVLTDSLDYTAYGALVEERAVCQGVSSAFYRLALELDVDNRLISGKVGTIAHGWNIVAIDGFYYNVDATKDAGFQPETYRYFLKIDLPDHIRDDTYDTQQFHTAYPIGPKDYDPHVHTWDAGTVTKEATCKETGVMTYACTGDDCKETYQEEIPVLTVHSWDGGIITQKPNGYQEGIKTYSCTVCTATREETLPRQGWEAKDGKWYYHQAGKLATGWHLIGGLWYYFDAQGMMKTGWVQLSGVWYYLKADGSMKTGWLQLGSTWYYLKADGAMKTGWLQQGNVWYYLKADGAMKTGWLQLGKIWYYFHSSGAMATGTVKVGNVTYRFRSDGSWIA